MNKVVQPIKEDRIVGKAWDVICPRCNGPQPGHILRTGKRNSDGMTVRVLDCPEKPMVKPDANARTK